MSAKDTLIRTANRSLPKSQGTEGSPRKARASKREQPPPRERPRHGSRRAARVVAMSNTAAESETLHVDESCPFDAETPPSTATFAPVVKLANSLARKAITAATSRRSTR